MTRFPLSAKVQAGWLSALVMLAALLAVGGCQNIKWRGQNESAEAAKFADAKASGSAKYISDAVAVWGMEDAKVENIGLVTGLNHTGSDPAPSWQRERLVKDMQAKNIKDPGEILASDTTSMVIVAANIPPGIRKGERFDVYVTTLPNSETTSLRGGLVMQTWLSPKVVLNGRPRDGHDVALAKGRIQVRSLFETNGDQLSETTGFVLGGGIADSDRLLGLAIRDEFATFKSAVSIARAINTRFSTYDETGKINVAEPKNDRNIHLLVPEAYRQNIGRYVRVVINIVYQESPEQRMERLEQLERELNEPALAQQAALRLEAIGADAAPALKRALHSDDAEVRFFAAEALTYLDEPDGIPELQRAAERMPDFRWHALTALCSSEEVAAGQALTDLMHVENAECRYGAFRAMLERSPYDPLMAGDWEAGEFFLHVVPSTASTLIHISAQKRAEVVVFGGNVPVSNDLIFIESGLTVQALGDKTVEMIRYLPGEGEKKLKCRNTVADVIRSMAQLGCEYSTLIAMCKETQMAGTLNAKMVINRVPTSQRMYARGGAMAEVDAASVSNTASSIETSPPDPALTTEPSSDEYPRKIESKPPKKGVFGTL